MYRIDDFYKQHGERLGLKLVGGKGGMKRKIRVPEAHRPGLSLTGYMKSHASNRLLIFGRAEIEYLREMDPEIRIQRLHEMLKGPIPAVIVARRFRPLKELESLCEKFSVPLFRTKMSTMALLSQLSAFLTEEFAPSKSCHGTLVEVFGIGIMLQGDSSVGKSEAALGLIERGHRLISDDIVKVRKREGNYLEGYGIELSRHHMEIRGIGIINVANLYGAVCVQDHKSMDLVVKLEAWDDQNFYDRVGLEEKFCDILGVQVALSCFAGKTRP